MREAGTQDLLKVGEFGGNLLVEWSSREELAVATCLIASAGVCSFCLSLSWIKIPPRRMESQSCIPSPLQYPTVSFALCQMFTLWWSWTLEQETAPKGQHRISGPFCTEAGSSWPNLWVLGQTNSCCQLVEKFLKIKYFSMIKQILLFWLLICFSFVSLFYFLAFIKGSHRRQFLLHCPSFPAVHPILSVCAFWCLSPQAGGMEGNNSPANCRPFSLFSAAFKHRHSTGSLGKGCWSNQDVRPEGIMLIKWIADSEQPDNSDGWVLRLDIMFFSFPPSLPCISCLSLQSLSLTGLEFS